MASTNKNAAGNSRPQASVLCLMASDTLALVISVGLALAAKGAFQSGLHVESYLRLWPFLFVFLAVYRAIGLYSIVGLQPAGEFRLGSAASAVLFLLLAAVTVSLRGAQQQFTWTLFLSLAISMALQPALRIWTRRLFASRPWWGYATVIFGAGEAGEQILNTLQTGATMGLKPVAFVDPSSSRHEIGGISVFDNFESARALLNGYDAYAIFAAKDFPVAERGRLIDRFSPYFRHVLVVPEIKGLSSQWAASKNIGGALGLVIGPA